MHNERLTENNMRFPSVAVAVVMMASLSFAGGHGKSGGRFGGGNRHGSHAQQSKQKPRVELRSKNSQEERAPSAREEFMRKTGFPKGRPGFVIEYIIPLDKGGTDTSVNMRWKEKAQPKAKGDPAESAPRPPKAERPVGQPSHHRRA